MKKRISKLIFLFVLPAIALSMVAVIFAESFAKARVCAEDSRFLGGAIYVKGAKKSEITIDGGKSLSGFSADDGGGVYVDGGGIFNLSNGSILNNSAENGGGVYVAEGGTFNFGAGTISGNTASEKGNNIYNSGTFTMNGGVVGEIEEEPEEGAEGEVENRSEEDGSENVAEETEDIYGIYNSGTMTILGGEIHDNIFVTTTDSVSEETLAGTLEISGGVVNGNIVGAEGSTIKITGGTINGTITTSGTLEISGGVVNGNIVGVEGSTIKITDGTTNGTITISGTLEISGGVVNADVSGLSGATITMTGGTIENDIVCEAETTITLTDGTISGIIINEGNVIIGDYFSYFETINLGTTGTITFENYVGTTPNFDIVVSEERGESEIAYLEGYTVTTNGVTEKITGFDTTGILRLKATVKSSDNKTIISLANGVATIEISRSGSNYSGIGTITLTWDGTDYSTGTYSIPIGTTIQVTQTAGSYVKTGITKSGGSGTFSSGSYTIVESDLWQTIKFTAHWRTYILYLGAVREDIGSWIESFHYYSQGNYSSTKYLVTGNTSGFNFYYRSIGYETYYKFYAIEEIDGYIFNGWYTNSSCTNLYKSNANIGIDLMNLRGDTTYYAYYKEPVYYTITFDAQGGTFTNDSSSTKTVASGSAIGTLPTAYKINVAFNGWWTSVTGGTQITKDTIVTGDVTYYAQYTTTSIDVMLPDSWSPNFGEDEDELSIRNFMSISDVETDILFDDKKKYENLLFVDKRYMSNGYEARNFQI